MAVKPLIEQDGSLRTQHGSPRIIMAGVPGSFESRAWRNKGSIANWPHSGVRAKQGKHHVYIYLLIPLYTVPTEEAMLPQPSICIPVCCAQQVEIDCKGACRRIVLDT
jgi:hypothetical protein